MQALSNWTERNLVNQYESRDKSFAINQDKLYSSKTNNKNFYKSVCIYCESDELKSVDCKTVTTLNDRRSILREKHICFNFRGFGDRAPEYHCKGCQLLKTPLFRL